MHPCNWSDTARLKKGLGIRRITDINEAAASNYFGDCVHQTLYGQIGCLTDIWSIRTWI